MRAAVLHMVADEPRLAVEGLGNGVLETDGDELGRKAAQLWLDLDPSLRAGTAILAPTHELRAEINEAVRHGLEDEGVLHGPALEIERYVNLHLTRPQKGDIANYRPGDACRVAGCAFAGQESNPLGSVGRFQIISPPFPGLRLALG